MGLLPLELRCLVQDALLLGTTFSEFVFNTRYLGEDRAEALLAWLEKQAVGVQSAPFEGTAEELEVITRHIEGKRVDCTERWTADNV
jgi:hypothetical protein